MCDTAPPRKHRALDVARVSAAVALCAAATMLTTPTAASSAAVRYQGPAYCGYDWLPEGTISVPGIAIGFGPVANGAAVGVQVLPRGDWGLWTYANLARCELSPPGRAARPAPPAATVPTGTPTRRPSGRPRPPAQPGMPAGQPGPSRVTPAPAPALAPTPTPDQAPEPTLPRMSTAPSPAPGAVLAAAPALASEPPHRTHLRHASRPAAFERVEDLPGQPVHPPAPVIPLAVLIMAVMAPCVAAAATRFVRRR
jgi:hypothetical protein